MERLSLNESPAPAPRTPQQNQQFSQNALGPAGPQPTGGPPQLPPQMFTTAAQLLDLTDSMCTQPRSKRPNSRKRTRECKRTNIADTITEKLVLILRDGRKLIGVLRSWDQFGTPVAPQFPSPFYLTFNSRSKSCFPGYRRARLCRTVVRRCLARDLHRSWRECAPARRSGMTDSSIHPQFSIPLIPYCNLRHLSYAEPTMYTW